ncbi:hypothetical protein Bca4012_074004 [Brassica carinata]
MNSNLGKRSAGSSSSINTFDFDLGLGSSQCKPLNGKTWGSSTGSGSGIWIVNKDPSLSGDLVGSAVGKSSGNVP